MSNLVLVDAGALQMVRNAMERISNEQGRPVLKEMMEELDKTIINVEEIKIVNGPKTARGWVEDAILNGDDNVQATASNREFSRFPKT